RLFSGKNVPKKNTRLRSDRQLFSVGRKTECEDGAVGRAYGIALLAGACIPKAQSTRSVPQDCQLPARGQRARPSVCPRQSKAWTFNEGGGVPNTECSIRLYGQQMPA